jgi:hypothetical protein
MGGAMALISCAECQHISDKAASCPHCGAPQNAGAAVETPTPAAIALTKGERKFGAGRILLGLLGLIVVGAIARNYETSPSSPPTRSTLTDVRSGTISGKPTAIVSVRAADLFREYADNEVATDNRLKGKIVEIIGTVESINKNAFDHIYVLLVTPNQFMSASIHVLQSEEQKMASLRKGQIVIFRCPKMQRWAGSPSGDDCFS